MNPSAASPDPTPQPSAVLMRYEPLHRRKAIWLDYLIFFIGIPVAIAFIFSLVGVRLIAGMPYLDGLLYMVLHMFVAWWSVSLCAWFIKLIFRSWKPPVFAICVLGFCLALIPTAFLFIALGDYYAGLYPSFAENRADNALPSWDFAYLLHFTRYSIPALPLFLAGVYVYRLFTGVDWYSYPSGEANAGSEALPGGISQGTQTLQKATANLIGNTQLADDAELLAIKAEQHYIHIWSDQGNEMVRYRFKDIPKTLTCCNGGQVHRSWWVNFDQVQGHRQNGRNLELIINEDLIIPVSLSFKNSVLNILEQREAATTA